MENNRSSKVWFKLMALSLLVSVASCHRASNLGIGMGVFHFAPDSTSSIKVYQNLELDSLLFAVSANISTGQSRLYLTSYIDDSNDFQPLRYGQLRGFLTLRVIEATSNRLKVVINEDDLQYGWIKGDRAEVEGWDAFLNSVHHISSIDERIHRFPNAGSESVNVSLNDCLNLVDIQGDWIKVHHDVSKCNDPKVNVSGPSGFMRWKKEGKVLLDFRM